MTLESIEKLREFIGDYFVNSGQAYLQGLAIAGSIEREIAERYMLLPADADGVPIHVGDVLDPPKGSEEYGRLIVTELTYDGEDWYFKGEIPASFTGQAGYFNVIGFAHVKPRTLENIVADAIQYGHNGITGDRIEGKVAEFCAEIRELLGGDAE